ncbi:hypothetical protein GH871_32550 [Bacillus thuringiensis]|nr:hypothetical protein [Bacillus thuringiensis]
MTKQGALEAIRWTIEEKEQLTEEELFKVFTYNWLIENGLKSPLKKI